MREEFLRLSAEERSEILRARAQELGRGATVLEKDVWVCWALDSLFSIPGMPRLAFKGGTSLSKVYGAIHRFSEDVDLSFDFRDLRESLGCAENPEKMTGEGLKRFRKALQEATSRLVVEKVVPHLTEAIRHQTDGAVGQPEADESGEKVRILYPSCLERDPYLKEGILLEFGGRNLTEPCSGHKIVPDIAAHIPELRFPEADVTVLAPERTFWEKATLIHAECGRGSIRSAADRPSRHWYDLALLADHDIGRRALVDRELFASVVGHKAWAFRDPKAAYERCLKGGLRLVPTAEPMRHALREDYGAMVGSGFFTSEPPTFAQIEARLSRLADEINESAH